MSTEDTDQPVEHGTTGSTTDGTRVGHRPFEEIKYIALLHRENDALRRALRSMIDHHQTSFDKEYMGGEECEIYQEAVEVLTTDYTGELKAAFDAVREQNVSSGSSSDS